jgi:hypothetical protein
LCLADASVEAATARIQTYQGMAMVSFAKWVMPNDAEIVAVLKQASSGPQSAQNLVVQINEARKPFVFRTLVWFLKLSVLKVQS